HLFNPAAFGVTVATVAGVAAQSWWATTNVWAIAVAGLILAFRLRRLPMVVAFWLVNLAFLFLSNPALLSAPPVSWFNPAILFLSLFMLTEPVTGPKSKEASIAYGVLLALFIPPAGLFAGAASVTLALLLTNLFAAPLDFLVLIVKMKGMMKKMLKSVGGPVK
ncbi:RnfABCDGE type electron transport complex subunit D, partial [Candidatus Micrarchaeota archaeon]|nr:RnfABCDGE type electron transport complex subunit D [Candidatus Micrarchaeota archaeon]